MGHWLANYGTIGCITRWYRREEAQKRYSFFFSSTTLAGAFGGLLASAIGKMDGMRGYRGWRWVFILGMDTSLTYRHIMNCPTNLRFCFSRGDPDLPCCYPLLLPNLRLP